jgi:hypothetical protein
VLGVWAIAMWAACWVGVRGKGVKVFAGHELGMRRWRLIGPTLRNGRWCTTHALRQRASERASDFRSRRRWTATTALPQPAQGTQADAASTGALLAVAMAEADMSGEESSHVLERSTNLRSSETMGGNYWQSQDFNPDQLAVLQPRSRYRVASPYLASSTGPGTEYAHNTNIHGALQSVARSRGCAGAGMMNRVLTDGEMVGESTRLRA